MKSEYNTKNTVIGLVLSIPFYFGVDFLIGISPIRYFLIFVPFFAVSAPFILGLLVSVFFRKYKGIVLSFLIGNLAIGLFFVLGTLSVKLDRDYEYNALRGNDPKACLKLKNAEHSPADCIIIIARNNNRPDFCQYYTDSTKSNIDAVNYCKTYVTNFNAAHLNDNKK